MEKKGPVKITLPSLIVVLILSFLLTYAIVDATVYKPTLKSKIENINSEFDSLDIFLMCKLPSIDSAINTHTSQIEKHNQQLEKLNKLTEQLKNK